MLPTEALTELEGRRSQYVNVLARRGDDALLTVASGAKTIWTLGEWRDLLERLDACNLTVGEWLDVRDLL